MKGFIKSNGGVLYNSIEWTAFSLPQIEGGTCAATKTQGVFCKNFQKLDKIEIYKNCVVELTKFSYVKI